MGQCSERWPCQHMCPVKVTHCGAKDLPTAPEDWDLFGDSHGPRGQDLSATSWDDLASYSSKGIVMRLKGFARFLLVWPLV